jgi:integrase
MTEERNPATIYLSKWSERSDTYRTMRNALVRLVNVLRESPQDVELFPWHELRYEDVRSLAAELADEEFKPPTINQSLSALRGVLEAAWRLGMLPDDAYRRIEIENVSGNSERAGRALPPEEMSVIVSSLSTTEPLAAAAIAILAGAGLRRVELVRLVCSDYDPVTKRLTATGKRNKRRSIPVGDRWQAPIERWWSTKALRDKLFDFGERDARRKVSYITETFCKTHKIPVFTPHDLRRTFGTHVEKTSGIAMAQQLLGHTNIQTTTLYVRINEERERAAVKDL